MLAWSMKRYGHGSSRISRMRKQGLRKQSKKRNMPRIKNPKSGKDISYHDALTLSPSLVCQEGLEEAIEYCELNSKAKMRMVEDFKAIGLTVRKGYIAKDVTALLIDHIQDIIRRKKRPFARILSKIAMIMATRPMTAYGLS